MAAAYYNEIEPFAADVLEHLISAGLIAPGYVDRRSIEDVRPDDLLGFTQCHFFAGVGVWSYALRRAGWPDDRRVGRLRAYGNAIVAQVAQTFIEAYLETQAPER